MKHVLVWGLLALALTMLVLASDSVPQDAVVWAAGLGAAAIAWMATRIPNKLGPVVSAMASGVLVGTVAGFVYGSLDAGLSWGVWFGIFMGTMTAWWREMRRQHQQRV